nr:uncharacterized protein LOC108131339 [Drosophila bipectinata]
MRAKKERTRSKPIKKGRKKFSKPISSSIFRFKQQDMMLADNTPSTSEPCFKLVILREMERLGRQPTAVFKRAAFGEYESQKMAAFANYMSRQKARDLKMKSRLVKKRKEFLANIEIIKNENDTMLENGQDFKKVILREMNRLGRQPSTNFKKAAKEPKAVSNKYLPSCFRLWTSKSKKIDSKTISTVKNISAKNSESSVLSLMSSNRKKASSNDLFQQQHGEATTMMETEANGQDMKGIIFREMKRLGREPTKENQIADKTAMSQKRQFSQNSRPFGWSYLKELPPNVISKKRRVEEEDQCFPNKQKFKRVIHREMKRLGRSSVDIEMADQTAIQQTSNMDFSPNSRPFGWSYLNEFLPNAISEKPERMEVEDQFFPNKRNYKEVIHREMNRLGRLPSDVEMADQTAMASNMDFPPNSRPFGWSYLNEFLPNAISAKPDQMEVQNQMDQLGRQSGEDFKRAMAKSFEPSGKSIQFTIPCGNSSSQEDILFEGCGPRTELEINQNQGKSAWNITFGQNIMSQNMVFPKFSLSMPNLGFQTVDNNSMSLAVFSPNTSLPVTDPISFLLSLRNQEEFFPEEQVKAVLKSLFETGIVYGSLNHGEEALKEFFEGLFEALLRSKGTCDKNFKP